MRIVLPCTAWYEWTFDKLRSARVQILKPMLPEQVLAASQSPVQKKWFQGTADAVRQYLWLFENSMREGVEDFLILAGMSHHIVMGSKG